jgi:hypothetical protein
MTIFIGTIPFSWYDENMTLKEHITAYFEREAVKITDNPRFQINVNHAFIDAVPELFDRPFLLTPVGMPFGGDEVITAQVRRLSDAWDGVLEQRKMSDFQQMFITYKKDVLSALDGDITRYVPYIPLIPLQFNFGNGAQRLTFMSRFGIREKNT